jgi:segregation and condensation protein B
MDELDTQQQEAQPEPQEPETPAEAQPEQPAATLDELLPEQPQQTPESVEDAQLKAVLEAIVYVAEEPLTLAQLSASLEQPPERIRGLLSELIAEFDKPEHGVTIREVAGGFKMATKPEHHDAVRSFVKSLKPPLKLSLPALETLSVIAYKQPVTGPEIMEIRGVQGAGVLKTLLDRKLIAVAGRKNVIGKPMLYKTTKEFLIQFGLKDLAELPSLKEFEEIRRMAFSEDVPAAETAETVAEAPPPAEAELAAEPPAPADVAAEPAEEPATVVPEESPAAAEPEEPARAEEV